MIAERAEDPFVFVVGISLGAAALVAITAAVLRYLSNRRKR